MRQKQMTQAPLTLLCVHTLIVVCFSSVTICRAESQLTYICTLGEDTRTIAIEYPSTEPVPCSVQYKRSGSSQTLWQAESAHGYCEEKAQVLLEKRRQAGWICQSENIVAVD